MEEEGWVPIDDRYIGILCDYRIQYGPTYNKRTTPRLEVVLFDYYAITAYHCCARDGRVILNVVWTETQVNCWGVVLASGAFMQRWDVIMTSTFMHSVLKMIVAALQRGMWSHID